MTHIEEREASYLSGWLVLPLWLAAMGWSVWSIAGPIVTARGAIALWAVGAVPLLLFLLVSDTETHPVLSVSKE